MVKYLDFEKPIIELRERIEELKALNGNMNGIYKSELQKLNAKLIKVSNEIFSSLTPWQRVEMARHPNRPYTNDYIRYLFNDWFELHGDRRFSDDNAIIAGIGSMKGISFIVVGHEKGRSTTEKIKRNFGSAHPEGYRKALRVMKLGGKFNLPIVCFVDTAGAYPGIGAEERGQALAIAENIKEIAVIPVPIIVIITGEGGSGGALAVGVGDVMMMLENSFYSVISPEGCAAILWKDQEAVAKAAEQLKFFANDLLEFGIVDEIIPEPPGGAHIDPEKTFKNVERQLNKALKTVDSMSVEKRLKHRYQKFRKIGVFKNNG